MDGDGLSWDGAKTKSCSYLLQVCRLPMLNWTFGCHVGFGVSLLGCRYCKSYGKTGHSEKRLQSLNICWTILTPVRPYFSLQEGGVIKAPFTLSLHCHPYLLPSAWKDGFSGKLIYKVSHSLLLFISLLRLPEVAFDHGRYPFPGITFPRCFWLKGKPRKTSTILIKM